MQFPVARRIALTPAGHDVLLVDGNVQPMDEAQIEQFVRDENIGLVGIGAMTRMVARAYRMADAIRATGVPVVMGGPHVTEESDEALGRDGGRRHADAVALGEADETWPQIVNDAVRGELLPVPCRRSSRFVQLGFCILHRCNLRLHILLDESRPCAQFAVGHYAR